MSGIAAATPRLGNEVDATVLAGSGAKAAVVRPVLLAGVIGGVDVFEAGAVDVGVDPGGGDVGVAAEFLNHAKVGAQGPDQVCNMIQTVRRRFRPMLRDAADIDDELSSLGQSLA